MDQEKVDSHVAGLGHAVDQMQEGARDRPRAGAEIAERTPLRVLDLEQGRRGVGIG
jgi:hypothetical protein